MALFPLWTPAFSPCHWMASYSQLLLWVSFLPGADGSSLTCRKVDIYHLLWPAALLFTRCGFTAWGSVCPAVQ